MLKVIVVLISLLSSHVSAHEGIRAIFSCAKTNKTPEDKRNCLYKASEEGNGDATYWLALAHEKNEEPAFRSLGIEKSEAESVRLKLLAYDQGNYDALFWYLQEYTPPKPYQWKVGMSKRQVLNSVAGEPRRIIKRSTEKGSSETWIYDGAYLFFGGVHDKFDALKEIQEIK